MSIGGFYLAEQLLEAERKVVLGVMSKEAFNLFAAALAPALAQHLLDFREGTKKHGDVTLQIIPEGIGLTLRCGPLQSLSHYEHIAHVFNTGEQVSIHFHNEDMCYLIKMSQPVPNNPEISEAIEALRRKPQP